MIPFYLLIFICVVFNSPHLFSFLYQFYAKLKYGGIMKLLLATVIFIILHTIELQLFYYQFIVYIN